LRSARNVWLIRDDKKQESRHSKLDKSVQRSWRHLNISGAHGRVRSPIANNGSIENAISIEENSALIVTNYCTDSHFVSVRFSRGCETIKCHTTA